MMLPGGNPSAASPGSPQANLPAESMQEAAEQLEGGEEGRVVGHVKWQIYTVYMKAVGMGLVLFVLLSLALMQASTPSFPPNPLPSPPLQYLSRNRAAGSCELPASLSLKHA